MPNVWSKYPALSEPSDRRKTFPRQTVDDAVDIEECIAAGFYHKRTSDIVKCFWCDGVLENWRRVNDYWEEHAK